MSAFLTDDDGNDLPERENTYAFVQYKGTDICMDFHCECGAHCHFDGDFAYVVECPHCHAQWEMPPLIMPRKRCKGTYHPDEMVKMLEPDGDFTTPEGEAHSVQ